MGALNKARIKELKNFSGSTLKAINSSKQEATSRHEAEVWERMGEEVRKTPFAFYDRPVLRASGKKWGTAEVYSTTLGEHVRELKVDELGRMAIKNYINLPAKLVFKGDKISFKGAMTMWHELAHFPKGRFNSFLVRMGIPGNVAEEASADFLAAKIATKHGIPPKAILWEARGRMGVYREAYPKFMRLLESGTKRAGKISGKIRRSRPRPANSLLDAVKKRVAGEFSTTQRLPVPQWKQPRGLKKPGLFAPRRR